MAARSTASVGSSRERWIDRDVWDEVGSLGDETPQLQQLLELDLVEAVSEVVRDLTSWTNECVDIRVLLTIVSMGVVSIYKRRWRGMLRCVEGEQIRSHEYICSRSSRNDDREVSNLVCIDNGKMEISPCLPWY